MITIKQEKTRSRSLVIVICSRSGGQALPYPLDQRLCKYQTASERFGYRSAKLTGRIHP